MSHYAVKYTGKRGARVYDVLKHTDVIVGMGELFLTDDSEIPRFRSLPDLFEVIREIDVHALLKESLEGSHRPFSHPYHPITRGKVLFLFNSEGGKYIGQRIWEFQIAMLLAGMGFSVHILTDEIPPYASEWPNANKISWERGLTTGYMGFDYVIGTPPQNIERAVEYGKKNSIPSILICGELISAIPGRPESSETKAELDKLTVQADKIIAPSKMSREMMIAKGAKAENVFVVHPSVNPNILFLDPSKKVNEVVLCSRLDSHKEIRQAVRSLLSHELDFDITCICTNAEKMFNEIGEGSKKHKITFMQDVSEKEKAKIFARAKALVHTSTWEGFGMVVLEALTLGTRVIARPLTVFKEVYGKDIQYYQEGKDFFGAVAKAISSPTIDVEITNKYRALAQEDQTIILEKLFERGQAQLPVDTSTIAIIGWSQAFGGGDVARLQQAKALQKAGYNVQMGCWGNISKLHGNFPAELLNSPNDAREWLRKIRPGVIVCDGNLATEIVPVAKELGIPITLYIHFWTPFLTQTRDLLKAAPDKIIRKDKMGLLSQVSKVFVNSDYTREVFKKFFTIEAPVIYPAIDTDRLKGISRKSPTTILTPILEVGPGGMELYEELLSLLPNRQFVVLYWRGLEEKKQQLIQKHPNLTIHDGVQEIAKYLSSAKILLYTTQVDHTFGLSFAEALLCGVPVIAPKMGNIPYLVKQGGHLLDSLGSKEWMQTIEKCFMDDKHYDLLVKGTRIDAKKLPVANHDRFTEELDIILSKSRQVSFFDSDILAARHLIKGYTQILDGVGVNIPQAQSVIAFGPPHFWQKMSSPRTFCYWASTLLQSEIDREMGWLQETVDQVHQGKLAGIISPSEEILLLASQMGCPKVYKLRVPAPTLHPIKKLERKKNHIIMFNSSTGRKNLLTQLLAVQKIGSGVTLHLTDGLAKQVPSGVLKLLSVVRHAFLHDDEYFTLIASASVGLQVTAAESFNQAAFQHFALGTPCLISSACPFWRDLPKQFQYLVVESIQDSSEIAEKIKMALNETKHQKLAEWASAFAKEWNKQVRREFAKIFS